MIYDSFFFCLKSRNSLRKNENNKIVHKDVMVQCSYFNSKTTNITQT